MLILISAAIVRRESLVLVNPLSILPACIGMQRSRQPFLDHNEISTAQLIELYFAAEIGALAGL